MNSFISIFKTKAGKPTFVMLLLAAGLTLVGSAWILGLLYHKPTWQTLAVSHVGPDVEVLALGSSRVHFGIDPAQYEPRLLGLPANYLNAVEMQKTWARYQAGLSGVKVVILETDVVTLLYDTLKVSPFATIPLGLRPWPSWHDLLANFDDAVHRPLWRFFLWRLMPRARQEFFDDLNSSFEPKGQVPGYIPSRVIMSSPAEKARKSLAQAKAELDSQRKDVYEENQAAFSSLIRTFNERNTAVLLLRFPRHESLRTIFPPAWDLATRKTLEELKVAGLHFRFLDYADDPLFETEDFRDSDHLNSHGASKLAMRLNPEIAVLLQ